MKIQILGGGCPNCKMLEAAARKAAEELSLDAEFEKVTDMDDILDIGVLVTPGLAIDGEVKSSGKVLTPEQAKEILRAAM